jgi:hypothetical protein
MTSFSALLWVAAADHLASNLISLASQSLLAGQSVHSIHGKKKPKIKKSEMTSCLGTPIVLNENQRMILHTVLFYQTLRPCAGSLPFRKMLQRVPMLVLFTVSNMSLWTRLRTPTGAGFSNCPSNGLKHLGNLIFLYLFMSRSRPRNLASSSWSSTLSQPPFFPFSVTVLMSSFHFTT